MYSLSQTVRWRLLSANNRDSGQSPVGYPDADSCRAGLDHLLTVIGELQPVHILAKGQRWEWQLALGGVVLAKSSRSFDRRLRCDAACAWFIQMAPLAAIGVNLRVVVDRYQGVVGGSTLPIVNPGSMQLRGLR
jgi:hypothetical protein